MPVSSIQYPVSSTQNSFGAARLPNTTNELRETGNGKRETKPSTQYPVPSTQRNPGAAGLLKTTNGFRAAGDGISRLAGNWLLATGYGLSKTRPDAKRRAK